MRANVDKMRTFPKPTLVIHHASRFMAQGNLAAMEGELRAATRIDSYAFSPWEQLAWLHLDDGLPRYAKSTDQGEPLD